MIRIFVNVAQLYDRVHFCVQAKRTLAEEREINKRQQVKLEVNLTAAQKSNQELEVGVICRACVYFMAHVCSIYIVYMWDASDFYDFYTLKVFHRVVPPEK